MYSKAISLLLHRAGVEETLTGHTLIDRGNGEVQLVHWDYAVPKPTLDELVALLPEAEEYFRVQAERQRILEELAELDKKVPRPLESVALSSGDPYGITVVETKQNLREELRAL